MIITLCGSNRFEEYFKVWNEVLSLSGHVVFTTSCYPSFKNDVKEWYTPEEKRILDNVHLGKIDASDAVLALNVCSYLGDSSLNEIQYAQMKGKKLYALESWGKGNGIGHDHSDEIKRYKKLLGIPVDFVSPIGTAGFKCPYRLLPDDNRGLRSALIHTLEQVK